MSTWKKLASTHTPLFHPTKRLPAFLPLTVSSILHTLSRPLYHYVHLVPSVASVMASSQRAPRLLMVSNKTTVTIKRSTEGSYSFTQGSGGLISGVSGLAKTIPYTWYGWPGIEIPESETAVLSTRLKDEFGSVPIFLDDELADRHYNGFASIIPLGFSLIWDGLIALHQIPSYGLFSTITRAR